MRWPGRSARARERAALHGHLSVSVLDAHGQVRARRAGHNIVCTAGFSQLAAALVWSGIQDQAATLSVDTATYLTPLYGAVGSGTGTPAKSDGALFSELGRQPVGGAAASPASSTVAATATWLFYFPSPPTAWTVTEAGIFAQAFSTAGAGTMVDHWAFSPSISVPTTNTLILEVSVAFGP